MHQISFQFFQRGITPERAIARTRKKHGSAIFPWGIHIWNFKALACLIHKIWHASKSVTNEQTDRCTDNPKPICHVNFFEVGGIKNTLFENAVLWYTCKLSLLCHLNVLDRLQSIRIQVMGIKHLFNKRLMKNVVLFPNFEAESSRRTNWSNLTNGKYY